MTFNNLGASAFCSYMHKVKTLINLLQNLLIVFPMESQLTVKEFDPVWAK